jgi:hypothetical protein
MCHAALREKYDSSIKLLQDDGFQAPLAALHNGNGPLLKSLP